MRLRISSVLFVAVFLSALDVSAAGKESSILPSSADQALARQIFQELININTTHANGSTAAAQLIAKRLQSQRGGALSREALKEPRLITGLGPRSS